MESSTNKYSKSLYLLDTITDIYFILFGLLKILSWYAKGQIKQLVHGKIEYWDLFKYTGITDVLFSALSLSFGHSYVGQWFRLVRMLTISMISLQQLPHIDVLVVSLLLLFLHFPCHVNSLFPLSPLSSLLSLLIERYLHWSEESNLHLAPPHPRLLCLCCVGLCLVWKE
jgi:hypothetical protein